MLILCVFVNRFGLDCNEVPETRPFLSLLHLYFTPSTPDLVQLGLYTGRGHAHLPPRFEGATH